MYYAVNTTKLFLLPPSVNIHPSYSRYSESNPNRIDYSKHNYSIQFNHTRIFCTTIFREPNFSLKAELTFTMKTTNLLFTVAHQAGTFFGFVYRLSLYASRAIFAFLATVDNSRVCHCFRASSYTISISTKVKVILSDST